MATPQNGIERSDIVVLRKELCDFVWLQEKILRDNDNKRHWSYHSNTYLLRRLRDEIQELEIALIDGDSEDIRHECADTANFAMMIANNNWTE